MIVAYGMTSEILNKKEISHADESLAARVLLDRLLESKSIPTSAEALQKDGLGKPFLPIDNIEISITHSEGLVAVALSAGEGKVGIDAELSERYDQEKQKRLVERFFNENEKREFFNENAPSGFVSIWTRKEAVAKRDGIGLAKSFGIKENPSGKIYEFKLLNFVLAVATEGERQIELVEFDKI